MKAEEEEVEEVAGRGSQQWANIELHTSSSDEVVTRWRRRRFHPSVARVGCGDLSPTTVVGRLGKGEANPNPNPNPNPDPNIKLSLSLTLTLTLSLVYA